MEETQIVVDVQASPLSESSPLSEAPTVVDLKAALQHELDTLWSNANEAENFTIFRTPHGISHGKKNLFEPSVISIGPFHRGRKHLRAMEEQKRRFLRDFLSREDNISLDRCISKMKQLETRTRRCYSETFDNIDSETFVKMMLLDGCFVLEHFLKKKEKNWKSLHEVGWNRHFIKNDLLLQENQIPFFIVEKLSELIGFNQDDRMDFVKYIANNLLAGEYIIPDPHAETPDTTDSYIYTAIPDTTDSIIANPPAQIPVPSTAIADPPAQIPVPSTAIADPPAQIPFRLTAIPDTTDSYLYTAIPDTTDSIIANPPTQIPVPSTAIADTTDSIIADPPAQIPVPSTAISDTTDSIIADPPAQIPVPSTAIPDTTDSYPYIIPFNITAIPDTTDSIIPHPPAQIPVPSTAIPDNTDSIIADSYLDEIPDPPAEIHHLVHLCYHYIVPNQKEQVVPSSKSFDLTTMFSANRIKGFCHRFLSRVLKRRSPRSTSRSFSKQLPNSTGNISSVVIPSATELKQKGLKFEENRDPKDMLDISYKHGVLKIPKLKINDSTKPIFANLIAFEHSNYGKQYSPFTSFVYFLDKLVNTPHDVTILQECGIIENWLGSEEELAHFINQVTESAVINERCHYLAKIYREVNRYSDSNWNKHRAILIRDYFSSPWTAISLVAALILLVLTCLQSFYAVYAYKYPPSS